ncbi:MAG: 50S ribosomal protein L21 [Dehalococcoidia bacterium]
MFAIIRSGGKQYRVRPGDKIAVERLDAAEGAEVALDEVLLVGDEDRTTVGSPTVAGATVRARVEAHDRAPKVTFFHFKNKTRNKTMRGHRQQRTQLVITDISAG